MDEYDDQIFGGIGDDGASFIDSSFDDAVDSFGDALDGNDSGWYEAGYEDDPSDSATSGWNGGTSTPPEPVSDVIRGFNFGYPISGTEPVRTAVGTVPTQANGPNTGVLGALQSVFGVATQPAARKPTNASNPTATPTSGGWQSTFDALGRSVRDALVTAKNIKDAGKQLERSADQARQTINQSAKSKGSGAGPRPVNPDNKSKPNTLAIASAAGVAAFFILR